MRGVRTLDESVASTFGISVQQLDHAWERARLGVLVGRTRPMPKQLHMVMRGARPRMKPRTEANKKAMLRIQAANAIGDLADPNDLLHALPGWTKPPPNPYPARKIGRPRPHLLLPVVNQKPSFMNKPEYGSGFWTSTYLPGKQAASDWVDWCMGERFPHVGEYRSYVLEVEESAFVLELDGPDSCHALMQLGYMKTDPYYEQKGLDLFAKRPQIDFEKLAEVGVAGVRLTENGNRIMHLNLYQPPDQPEFDFNAWDSESTLWLRWAFTKVRVGPKIRISERTRYY